MRRSAWLPHRVIIIRVGIRVASNIKKNIIISVEEKAKIKKTWREIRREIYARCRLMGSGIRWYWLARIIIGNNQHDKTRRGVESRSVPM